MAKVKTEFKIMANTLKTMAKQCTAKAKDNKAALMAVFIDRSKELAIASDNHKIAVLDMFGHMSPEEINELSFYADMQAIEYENGFALISAKKKECFVKNFGNGLASIDTHGFDYPDLFKILPNAEGLNHVSQTQAIFLPSNLQSIDKIVSAAEKNDQNSVVMKLYGLHSTSIHVAFYDNLLVGVMPIHVSQSRLEEIPNNSDYSNSIRFVPEKESETINETTDIRRIKMRNELMIDLETTGHTPGCKVLSIGAFGFDKDGLQCEFYKRFDPSLQFELTDDVDTLEWWQNQSKEARDEAFGGKTSPEEGICDFKKFFYKNFDTSRNAGFRVWCCGLDFDFPILQYFFKTFGYKFPWMFWTQYDYRTIKNLFSNIVKPAEGNVMKHNALEDAKAQMRGLRAFYSM